MKKRFIPVFFALIMALSPAAAQTGNVAIGPIWSVSFQGVDSALNGLGITGKLPGLAPIFGLNFSLGSDSQFVGLTADWLLYRAPLYAPFNVNFYLGPGFYSSVLVADENAIDFGLRIPIGINWVPVRVIEVFLEIAPAFGISIQDPIQPAWKLQSALGARFWF